LDGESNPYEEQERMEVTDHYMMGPSILVAPVFTGQTERKIALPKGNWYDFYTGAFMGNGETITIKTKLEQIPLLVKDGAIIPMLSSKETKNRDKTTLVVRHYGTKENTYQLYNDDGDTFNYEKGDNTVLELKVVKGKGGKLEGQSNYLNNKKYTYGEIEWLWMSN
jgi:alpha-D-xyloside xylohydrolase